MNISCLKSLDVPDETSDSDHIRPSQLFIQYRIGTLVYRKFMFLKIKKRFISNFVNEGFTYSYVLGFQTVLSFLKLD